MSDRGTDVFPGGMDPRALPDLSQRARSAHPVAATVTGVFCVAGLVWVLVTDVLLYDITRDRALIARIETAKGWSFIGLSCLLLYAVTFLSAARLDRVRRLTAAVVESIGDGVLLLGHDRTIAYANPAAVRMLGRRRKDLVGMTADEFSRAFRVSYPSGALVPPDSYISQRAFDEGGPLHYKVTLHPTTGELAASITAAGVRLEIGAPATWVVSVIHDVSATDQLERMRDQFFAAAAHTLKTPAAVIKADAQLLQPAIPARYGPVAASIERQSDRIDRLVQNLIVLARARSSTLELHPSAMALGPLVERIAREPIWSHRHEVHTEVTGAPAIHGDQERLALVIRNLVYEASRLSEDDSALTLVARPEGDRVAVGVRYRPVAWRDRATDPYGEYDDIGIGRCVAETIAEGHGGSLGQDAGDTETTSWIYLPADEGAPH